jgi:RNA polymerase sigma factor (sigma-70 family)
MSNGKLSLETTLSKLSKDSRDGDAWTELFEAVSPFVLSVCHRTIGNQYDFAEDAAQEVFVRLARYCPFDRMNSTQQFYSYLRKLIRSVCSDMWARYPPKELPMDDTIPEPEAPDADEALARIIKEERLEQALSALSSDDQQLATLILEGYSLDEIKVILGVSYSTAGVRLHRLQKRING